MKAVADINTVLPDDRNTSLHAWNTPLRGFNTPILLGLLTYEPKAGTISAPLQGRNSRRTYNSAILIDGDGRVRGRYDKNYLLVFGEYIPLGSTFPQFYDWLPEASHFEAGTTVETFDFKGFQLGVMICYEDIIPRFTRRLAGKNPNVLINVTNDAWFGKTSEPYLHLALAIFRAVENRLWLIRSTNTGVSAYVDAVGRLVSQTRLEDPEILAEDVPMMSTVTPYRRYGDLFSYACIVAFLLLASIGFIKKRA
jgi:apolipoprotein N-acyltransferase